MTEAFIVDHPQELLEVCLVHIQKLSSEKEKGEEYARYLATSPSFFKQPWLELGKGPTKSLPFVQQVPRLELK